MGLSSRLQHAWNAFMNRDPTDYSIDYGFGTTYKPDRPRLTRGNERSIVTSVYNRIAMDVAAVHIVHARLDGDGRFKEIINSGLNNCLTLSANIDQTGRDFIQDIVLSLMDEGCIAIVPVDTTINPNMSGRYDIDSMRTGKILEWHPRHVKVQVYNDATGQKQDVMLPKENVAIIENPLYSVINEPNSTNQRLIRKLNLLDAIDEQSGSGKLDLVIQLPYVIKSEARKVQAENRRKEIENQLNGTKYGIAYTDGTEKITQLNRSVDNNLMKQIEYLTSMLYSQLGITTAVLDGTADEKTMLNYNNRIIEPILSAITNEMSRKFLTKTARSQKQTITFFSDPFKLVPVSDIAEIADKFTRNEIMTSNEIRQVMGMKPVDDARANELRNKNLNAPEQQDFPTTDGEESKMYGNAPSSEELDELDQMLDNIESELDVDEDEEDTIKHYASPYYDPVKAHEYYMRTRQLKGKTSSSNKTEKKSRTLNDSGKAASAYVRNQMNTEKSARASSFSNNTKSKISILSKQLKNMPPAMRAKYKHQISQQVSSLRNSISVQRKKLDTEYNTKYQSEVGKMKLDSKLTNPVKTKKRKSSSKQKTNSKKDTKSESKSTTK